MDNVYVAGFRVSKKDVPRFVGVGDAVVLSLKATDDSVLECGFQPEELAATKKMAVRVMIHEEPADRIFTFAKGAGNAFVDANADLEDRCLVGSLGTATSHGRKESSSSVGLLDKAGPLLGDPQAEYRNRAGTRFHFYEAVTASAHEDNFQSMVHEEYLAQLAHDSIGASYSDTGSYDLIEMSAVVKTVGKAGYGLSGEPGSVYGVMVTTGENSVGGPNEDNSFKSVLFRTILKCNVPGISKAKYLCPGVIRPGDRFSITARRALTHLALDSGFAYFAKRIKFKSKEPDVKTWVRVRDEAVGGSRQGEEEDGWVVQATLVQGKHVTKASKTCLAQITASAVAQQKGKRALFRLSALHLGTHRIGGNGLAKLGMGIKGFKGLEKGSSVVLKIRKMKEPGGPAAYEATVAWVGPFGDQVWHPKYN